MEEKLFNALKTRYASLGLGDTILEAEAVSLNKSGLVNDENIDAVVASRETALKAMQSGLDKRASDATDGANKKAKTQAEELNAEIERLKAEADKGKATAAELEKLKAELEASKADAAATIADYDKLKTALDKLHKKATTASKAATDPTKGAQPSGTQNTPPAPPSNGGNGGKKSATIDDEEDDDVKKFDVEAFRTSLTSEFTKSIEALKAESVKSLEAMKAESDKVQASLLEQNKALSEKLAQFEAEKAKADADKAAAERQAFIANTAKSLGIPEWRSSEGFVIADTATNDDITAYLGKIADNLKANQLPTSGVKNGMGNNTTSAKFDDKKLAEMAANIVSHSNF